MDKGGKIESRRVQEKSIEYIMIIDREKIKVKKEENGKKEYKARRIKRRKEEERKEKD